MNILLLTSEGHKGTGATFSIAYLAKGLANKGHNVYVGCTATSFLPKLLTDTKVNVVPMVFKSKWDKQCMLLIKETVEQHQIQLINAQASKDRYLAIFSRWIYRLPVKIVHTRRQSPRSSGGKLHNWFYTKNTDKIVVISDQLKKTFVKKGVPEKHLHVIYNGLPHHIYDAVNPDTIESLRKKHNIKPGDKIIGCVSRKKKQEQLIKALKHLDPSVRVFFAGVAPGIFDEIIAEEGVQNEITYLGVIPHELIMNYYKLFDVMVLPSVTEGFGLVLVEAMGVKTPVIGTRAEGMIDVLDNETNGLWYENENTVELAEKIKQVLYDEATRNRLIENGYKSAKGKFSISHTVDNWEAFFENLIKAR